MEQQKMSTRTNYKPSSSVTSYVASAVGAAALVAGLYFATPENQANDNLNTGTFINMNKPAGPVVITGANPDSSSVTIKDSIDTKIIQYNK